MHRIDISRAIGKPMNLDADTTDASWPTSSPTGRGGIGNRSD